MDVDTSKMSDEELQFHYFAMHDYDNSRKLDGLEILRALTHNLHHEDSETPRAIHEGMDKQQKTDFQNEKLKYYLEETKLVDEILKLYDQNDDGYISYDEYNLGRQKEMETYNIKN
ncbi:hypothetical protein B4U79_10262, partial [Dinothrombium tinctorium]